MSKNEELPLHPIDFPEPFSSLKALEATGAIDPGAAKRLRKEAKAASAHGYKALRMLANALKPVISLDMFMPRSTPGDVADPTALTKRPVLVMCCDEERKQFPCCKLFQQGVYTCFLV